MYRGNVKKHIRDRKRIMNYIRGTQDLTPVERRFIERWESHESGL